MAIEDTMQADVLTFIGSLLYGSEDVVRDQVEEISKSDQKREKIVVILETDGGNIEVTQRIAETIRHHYDKVEYLVPNYAMSAGTVLVMSGDARFGWIISRYSVRLILKSETRAVSECQHSAILSNMSGCSRKQTKGR